jgi:hypothetical protein
MLLDMLITEGYVVYTLHSGTVLDPINLASFYKFAPNSFMLEQTRAYIDVGPVFAAVQAEAAAKEL